MAGKIARRGGIVTRYEILEQPHEHGQAVKHPRLIFSRAPRLVAGDQGGHFGRDGRSAHGSGVKLVTIPSVGKAPEERRALERASGNWDIGGVLPTFRRRVDGKKE